MKHKTHRTWLKAIPFVAVCMIPGFLSSFLGGAWKTQPWYDESQKPAFWPPQWFFPIVWIANYILMGTALYHVWQRRKSQPIAGPVTVFGLHLLHNISFIPIVYKIKRKSVYVLMDTIGLSSGFLTTFFFRRVSRRAGGILLPYLAWLVFTTSIKVAWWRIDTKE